MSKIFSNIDKPLKVDEEKNNVVVTFKDTGLEYKFLMVRNTIIVANKSHAVIAAVTGKLIKYDGGTIEATNKVFDWLNIEYTVKYNTVEKVESHNSNNIISYF